MSSELNNEEFRADSLYPEAEFREMVDAGVFFGRKKTKTHPRMRPNVLTNRNGIEIIDLNKTKESLNKALNFLKEKIKSGGTAIFVATQPAAEEDAKNTAAVFNFPVVARRWLGGTLTNVKIILARVEYFKKLKNDWVKDAFSKYTKKERLMIERELNRLEELFSGLENLTSRPDVLVVIDPNFHKAAVREANHLKIPIIAFVNTDNDPESVNYPVPGNNRARKSIAWFLGKIKEAINEAKNAKAVVSAETASNGEK